MNAKTNASMINAYPNPAESNLFVELNTSFDGELRLLNMTGHKLWSKFISAKEKNYSIDTQEFPNGLYYLQFYDQEGNNYSQKIIITH